MQSAQFWKKPRRKAVAEICAATGGAQDAGAFRPVPATLWATAMPLALFTSETSISQLDRRPDTAQKVVELFKLQQPQAQLLAIANWRRLRQMALCQTIKATYQMPAAGKRLTAKSCSSSPSFPAMGLWYNGIT